MEWKGIVTPNIAKGLTCGFLLFAQDEKRGRMKHKPSGSLSRPERRTCVLPIPGFPRITEIRLS
jgi:hypothetical protein